jgi:hypothetical protein
MAVLVHGNSLFTGSRNVDSTREQSTDEVKVPWIR